MRVAQSCPWAAPCQALLSMEFSRQEYWSWLPFPSPEDILDRGIKPGSPALQVDSLPSLWQKYIAVKLNKLAPWKKSYDKPRQCIKKWRHYFVNKGSYSQSYGFSSNRVWIWELDHKEDWALKNWCFWTVVLEKTLESPLNCQEINPVNPKGNQS